MILRRDAMDPGVRAEKSAQICRRLERLLEEALPAGCAEPPLVAIYAAMGSEVSLAQFEDAARRHGWQVCFPCMLAAPAGGSSPASGGACAQQRPRSRMAFFCVPPDMAQQRDAPFFAHPARACPRGDASLSRCREVLPHQVSAVAVPLVAFDARGNRLGYGGGNYDRFLPQLPLSAAVVGVAFREQQVDSLPLEPHDRALPNIVSA